MNKPLAIKYMLGILQRKKSGSHQLLITEQKPYSKKAAKNEKKERV
jgi:hypothetical protein